MIKLLRVYANNSFLPFFFLGIVVVLALSQILHWPGGRLLAIGFYAAVATIGLMVAMRVVFWLSLKDAFQKIRSTRMDLLSVADLSKQSSDVLWAIVIQAVILSCVGVAYGWLLMAMLLQLPR